MADTSSTNTESTTRTKSLFSLRQIEWKKYFIAEPIMFFLFASIGFRNLSGAQILQDKVCVAGHGLSLDYCRNLSFARADDVKLSVLQDYQIISTYRTLLQFFISNLCPLYLFIGGFCDAYPNGRRIALLGLILDGILQTLIVMLNNINMAWSPWVFIITGLSPINDYTCIPIISSYIIVNSKPEERVGRMMVVNVIFPLGLAVGFLFSGLSMSTHMDWVQVLAPWQIHNTLFPLMIGLFFQICALIWTYLFIKPQPIAEDPHANESAAVLSDESVREKSLLRKLFDLQLLKSSFESVFKKRPYNMRFNLFIVIIIQGLVTFTQFGPQNNILPVLQLIYKWDPSLFSIYSTVSLLWKPISLFLVIPLVNRYLQRSDLQVIVFGLLGFILGQVCVGSILHPAGFFLASFLDCSTTCSLSGPKSYLSGKIPASEITKVFFALQLVESLVPPLGSVFYTAIVSYSQSFYPSLMFHASAFIALMTMLLVVYLDISSIPMEQVRDRDQGKELKKLEHESDGPFSSGGRSDKRDQSAPTASQNRPNSSS